MPRMCGCTCAEFALRYARANRTTLLLHSTLPSLKLVLVGVAGDCGISKRHSDRYFIRGFAHSGRGSGSTRDQDLDVAARRLRGPWAAARWLCGWRTCAQYHVVAQESSESGVDAAAAICARLEKDATVPVQNGADIGPTMNWWRQMRAALRLTSNSSEVVQRVSARGNVSARALIAQIVHYVTAVPTARNLCRPVRAHVAQLARVRRCSSTWRSGSHFE